MKISHLAIALTALSLSPAAFAADSILALELSAKELNNVKISKGGKLTVKDRVTNVITVGAGIRTAIFGVKPYVGELLVNDQSKYCAGGKGLENLKDLTAVAMKVSVTSSFATRAKFLDAFTAGFKANKVSATDADVVAFMNAVKAGAEPRDGTVLNFAGEKLANGAEAVTYQDAAGNVVTIEGKAGFVRNIFSLWLGETQDDGLEDLISKLKACQI